MMNSLSFSFSGYDLTSSSLLKNSFVGYRILIFWQLFFSVNTLNMSFHCLLACMVSHEKFVINLLQILFKLWVISFLLLPRLCLSLFFNMLMTTCLSMCLLEYVLLGACHDTWMCRFYLFTQFRKFLTITSLDFLYFPFSLPLLLGLLSCICWYTWWYPSGGLGSANLTSFFISSCYSDWIIRIDFFFFWGLRDLPSAQSAVECFWHISAPKFLLGSF